MHLSNKSIFFLFLNSAGIVQAHTTFNLHCPGPEHSVNFVSSPDARGTLDILWSCLFTVLACTWTILHLNVPEQREGRDPEVLVSLTTWNLTNAKIQQLEIEPLVKQDDVPWSLKHSLFADMGGFTLPGPSKTTMTGKCTTCSGILHINADQLRRLRKGGLIPKLPSITVDDIQDKTKSDSFTKIIAVVQISWTALQVIVRWKRGLAISQLELAVIAFSLCAVITYALQWSKPKDIQTPYTVHRYSGHIPQQVLEGPGNKGIGFFMNICRPPFDMKGAPLPNDSLWKSSSDIPKTYPKFLFNIIDSTSLAAHMGLLLSTTLFGAIHVAAWNFSFPNQMERNLWRTASVLCTALPLIVYLFLCAGFFIVWSLIVRLSGSERDPKYFIYFGMGFIAVTSLIYLLARLFILIEVFRTLFFLSPDVYLSTWATNIPHIM
ncbi:hypothetical protein N431DRAFT_549410 [Stipitochalara longipes BDJ]|nr:hypothetical protein N431DRAFT_549410 [Stipitochalara longipes BDJ]